MPFYLLIPCLNTVLMVLEQAREVENPKSIPLNTYLQYTYYLWLWVRRHMESGSPTCLSNLVNLINDGVHLWFGFCCRVEYPFQSCIDEPSLLEVTEASPLGISFRCFDFYLPKSRLAGFSNLVSTVANRSLYGSEPGQNSLRKLVNEGDW